MASVHLIGLRISLWQCLGDHEGGGGGENRLGGRSARCEYPFVKTLRMCLTFFTYSCQILNS